MKIKPEFLDMLIKSRYEGIEKLDIMEIWSFADARCNALWKTETQLKIEELEKQALEIQQSIAELKELES